MVRIDPAELVYGRRSPKTYVSVAYQLRHRLEALAWLMKNGISHVHPATAARVLGVSKSRIQALVARGRLRIVEGFPGSSERDRYIPVCDLAAAPTALDVGRRRGWHIEHRTGRGDIPEAVPTTKTRIVKKSSRPIPDERNT